MKSSHIAHSGYDIDLAEIEARARQMRAEAIRDFALAVKSKLTGLLANLGARRVEA